MIKSVRVNLYGKPSERLIFVGLCEKYNCTFTYDEDTGFAIAQGENAFEVRKTYEAIIATAYKRLAFMQADHRFDNVPNKTLVSQFMQVYATWTYSLLTGKTVMTHAKTEVEREAIKAFRSDNG